jgi:hypothetical protein
MNYCEYIPKYHFQNTSFNLYLTNGPNKLECYITLGWKDLPVGPFINYKENEVLRIRS